MVVGLAGNAGVVLAEDGLNVVSTQPTSSQSIIWKVCDLQNYIHIPDTVALVKQAKD